MFSNVGSEILYRDIEACCCLTNNISIIASNHWDIFLKKILWPGYAVKRELQKIKLKDVGLRGVILNLQIKVCPYTREYSGPKVKYYTS